MSDVPAPTPVDNLPIQESVDHGPYAPNPKERNEAFNQAAKLGDAIVDAYRADRITPSTESELGKGVIEFAMKGIAQRREAEIAAQDGMDASNEDMSLFFDAQDIAEDYAKDIEKVDDDKAFEYDLAHPDIRDSDFEDDGYDDEDPLAGDVDKLVPSHQTDNNGGYASAQQANVARQHGDYTG